MEKLKIKSLKDLCGKYIGKFISFKWNDIEKELYVYYNSKLVQHYNELNVFLEDYKEYVEIDTSKEFTINEAINYIFNKYPNIIKVSFNREKVNNKFIDNFTIKQEQSEGIYCKDVYYNKTPEEMEIKII